MLFNSYTFIFAFLPLTLLGYFILVAARAPRRIAIAWLVLCSLFFYGWWEPRNLWLLGFLLLFNYALGALLGKMARGTPIKLVLAFGLAVNLGILCYYKYANFFLDTLNEVAGTHAHLASVMLPLGISFFIFQKIAYLVDAYRGRVRGYSFIDYSLFVTFFPQLIAGPIVHHSEVVPQFTGKKDYRANPEEFSVGISMFIAGLAKKVVLADTLATYASRAFGMANPSLMDAWVGALAYTLQLYFDFSGYSDMALGLGLLFGIRLPLNFFSPYKAVNIADFWRRWHMTLSRFLRDYLYIPLGGNRRGPFRRYLNLMVTMLLGGLWHGAGWTYVFWGFLHGAFLAAYHAWSQWRGRLGLPANPVSRAGIVAARAITFLCVVVAWVYFRAPDFASANRMLLAMAGFNGLGGFPDGNVWVTTLLLGVCLLMVWFAPNTAQIFNQTQSPDETAEATAGGRTAVAAFGSVTKWLRWEPSLKWALALAVLTVATFLMMSKASEFIYWQF